MQHNNPHIAVIGSSPLCLMKAISERHLGHKVTLYEGEPSLGGAWQTAQLKSGIEVETACHLIENHGNAYQLLENYSQIPFERLNPQPVKIFPDNSHSIYSSRRTIWSEAVRYSALIMAQQFARILSFNNIKLKRLGALTAKERNENLNAYLCFLRYRLIKLITGANIHHPKGGSVAFIHGLINCAKTKNVSIISKKVIKIVDNGRVKIIDADGNAQTFDSVFLSSSVSLSPTTQNEYEACKRNDTTFNHCVYFFPNEFIKNTNQYLHCVNDHNLHRITLVDSISALQNGHEKNGQYFLVQFRSPSIKRSSRLNLLYKFLLKNDLVVSLTEKELNSITEHAHFAQEFVPYPKDSSLEKTTQSSSSNIIILDTIGDLGRLATKSSLQDLT